MAQGLPLHGTRWFFAAQAGDSAAGRAGRLAASRQLLYVLNPNAISVPLTFTYYRNRGAPLVVHATVRGSSTYMEDIGADLGSLASDVAVVVNAPHIVSVVRVIQRALSTGAALNADLTPGVTAPARHWQFAEGYIGLTYREYLTLFNPSPAQARVTVRFAPRATVHPRLAQCGSSCRHWGRPRST